MEEKNTNSFNKKIIIGFIAILIIFFVSIFVYENVQKNNLEKHLQSTHWITAYNESKSSWMDISFDNSKINIVEAFTKQNITTTDYKILSKDKILVGNTKIDVQIRDDYIKLTPAVFTKNKFDILMDREQVE